MTCNPYAVVTHSYFDYDFTKNKCCDLHRFSLFCNFCSFGKGYIRKLQVGKMLRNTVFHGFIKQEDFMIKVLFVCHGNICRSPMAEFVFKDMVQKAGLAGEFYIASAATSTEEIGNPVHHGTRNKLRQYGISTEGKYARQMTMKDFSNFDYILGMDQWNLRNMMRIAGKDPEGKIRLLLDYSDNPRDIADPWYTGNFDLTYEDIVEGCQAFLEYLKKNGLTIGNIETGTESI